MKPVARHAYRLIFVGILVTAVVSMLMAQSRGRALQRVLAQAQNGVTLSLEESRQLAKDLKSSNVSRLDDWSEYLARRSKARDPLAQDMSDLLDQVESYRSKEWPGKSNRFLRLVTTLDNAQELAATHQPDLLRYLGEPDGVLTNGEAHVLSYRFSIDGTNGVVRFTLTNAAVSAIEVDRAGE